MALPDVGRRSPTHVAQTNANGQPLAILIHSRQRELVELLACRPADTATRLRRFLEQMLAMSREYSDLYRS